MGIFIIQDVRWKPFTANYENRRCQSFIRTELIAVIFVCIFSGQIMKKIQRLNLI